MFRPEQIRERVREQPFVPIRIVTSSGESYEVHHPDMIWVGAREIHVGIPSAWRPEFFDGISRVSLRQITAIEDLPRRQGPKGNGQRQPKKKGS